MLIKEPKAFERKFVNGKFCAGIKVDDFVIETYYVTESAVKNTDYQLIGCRVFEKDNLIFEQNNVLIPQSHSADNPVSFHTILHTAARRLRNANLGMLTMDLEGQICTAMNTDKKPIWACRQWGKPPHCWIGCNACAVNFKAKELY